MSLIRDQCFSAGVFLQGHLACFGASKRREIQYRRSARRSSFCCNWFCFNAKLSVTFFSNLELKPQRVFSSCIEETASMLPVEIILFCTFKRNNLTPRVTNEQNLRLLELDVFQIFNWTFSVIFWSSASFFKEIFTLCFLNRTRQHLFKLSKYSLTKKTYRWDYITRSKIKDLNLDSRHVHFKPKKSKIQICLVFWKTIVNNN